MCMYICAKTKTIYEIGSMYFCVTWNVFLLVESRENLCNQVINTLAQSKLLRIPLSLNDNIKFPSILEII